MFEIYASVDEVENGFRTLSCDEKDKCQYLLSEASALVDSYRADADESIKNVVVCRVVRRLLGNGSDMTIPYGASQGSMSGLGYSESWTMGSGGAVGEIYLSKTEKKLLGVGNRIGAHSPLEDM